MAVNYTDIARRSSELTNIQTNLVLEIEGLDLYFGSIDIKKYVLIGDEGLTIGDAWRIGGVIVDPRSRNLVNYDKGTTKTISQTLRPDKVQGQSTTQFVVSLTDINEQASLLASRGGLLDDLLGRRCVLWQGFDETGFKTDYIPILRGRIQKITSGATFVSLAIKNTEESKKRAIFNGRSTTTTQTIGQSSPISSLGVTTIGVFTDPATAVRVNGDPETTLAFLAKVDNEYFEYDGITGSDLDIVQRGVLTTTEQHDSGAPIQTAYRFTGPMLEIALRIMLSGWNSPHNSGVEVTNINVIDTENTVQNALLFKNIDVEQEYGIVEGSYVSLTGSAGNDFTNRIVSAVIRTRFDSYIIVDGADLTDEIGTSGTVSFRSQYDTYGQGLKMHPNEVDIARYQEIFNTYLSTFEIDVIVDDIPSAKAFLDEQLLSVYGCYTILRKGRTSLNYQSPPVPGERIFEINIDSVLNPEQLRIERDLTKYFYNSVDYQYNKNYDTGNYEAKDFYESTQSKQEIIDIDSPLVIKADSVRVSVNGADRAQRTAARILARYAFGAQFITGVKLLPKVGLPIEIGDIVLLDTASLKVTDFEEGTRSGNIKKFEVMNKKHNQATSEVSIDLLDTSFAADARVGRVAPSSNLGPGNSTTKLNIVKSYGTPFYKDESFKWVEYIGQTIRVRKADYSSFDEVTLQAVNDNSLLVDALSFTPAEGDIVTAPFYNTDTDPNTLAYWKAKHAYLGKKVNPASYISQTQFTINAGDAGLFYVGAAIQIVNEDYTNVGPVTEITDITGTTITMEAATGFVFDTTYIVRYVSFNDGGVAYRYV